MKFYNNNNELDSQFNYDRPAEVSKSEPCIHCGKPDWCYRIGALTVCKRGVEPAIGWEKTSKSDKESTPYYAPTQPKKSIRPANKQEFFYLDRKGIPLVKVLRIDDGQGKKDFPQFHWNAATRRWVSGLPDEVKKQVPIYRYQQVKEAASVGRPIFVVEGEGVADRLWEIGLCATTTLGGSGKFHSYGDYQQDLTGAKLVLCPDRDEPGLKYMKAIAQVFPDAKWVYAPPNEFFWQHLPKSNGVDIADWIDSGATAEDICNAIEQTARFELHPDNLIDFDAPLISTESAVPAFGKSYEKKPSLTQEQLVAEIELLIDENPTESKLSEVLPFLARLANITTRDVQAIYATKLTEMEMNQSPEELRRELEGLLAMGGESLNLDQFLPSSLAIPIVRLADRIGARPEALLLTMLVGISCVHKVGTNLEIALEDDFFVTPNLYAGIVAESGRKKSPILKIFIRRPLTSLENKANEPLRLIYAQALEEWQECPKLERKEHFSQGEPTPPALIDYYFSDATVEGINRQFSNFPERSMLYLRDELAGVFAFNKYSRGKGSERQDYLSFYDGNGNKELRASGFISRAERIQLSIFGTIQPEILQTLMQDPLAADGQWARFLFVIQPPRPAQLKKSGSFNINTELLNPLYERIDRLPVMHYKLTPDAFDYYQRHYDQLEVKACTHPNPAMRAVFSKMEGTIGRLALNLHVIHEVLRGETEISEYIPKVRIVQACGLTKFFINQIKLLDASVQAQVDKTEIAPNLAAIVERSRRVGAVDARSISKSILAFRHSNAQEIRGYFRQLADLGYGECKGGGAMLKFTAYVRSND